MTRSTRKKSSKKKRIYALTILLVLLAAVGAGLYRLPPSLLDVGIISRLAANSFFSRSADKSSAEAVLRGTIFDRNLSELAVSYRLYALYVRPSEIADIRQIAGVLSRYTGLGESELEIRLRSGGKLIKIAENLEKEQVDKIAELELTGVSWKQVEERFYPEHESAAGLVGYAGEGVGLAGIEGTCDTVLQHGEFLATSVPEVDFEGSEVIGGSRLDIILTLDIGVQKEVEKKLNAYLQSRGATRGLAIVMQARTGAVLAWAESPSFNPNYFWQDPGVEHAGAIRDTVDVDLLRDILVRAAAARKQWKSGGKLLPETVASPNYGLQEDEIRGYAELIGLRDNYSCRLPSCLRDENADEGSMKIAGNKQEISALQFITAVAGMLNGGWYVEPHVLDSIYDESLMKRYERAAEKKTSAQRRTMTPSVGLAVRMNFPGDHVAADKDILLHAQSATRVIGDGTLSRYVLQDMVVGATPAKVPEIVMLMVTWQDTLDPLAPSQRNSDEDSLLSFGREILPRAYTIAASEPAHKELSGFDASNYNRFLISRRIDYRDREMVPEKQGPVMPLLSGMSLRKGLQRLNAYNVHVRVEGSGRIVDQQPESGKPLHGVKECTLILESNI